MQPTAQYQTEYFWKFATAARRAAPGGDREAIAAPVDELCMIAIHDASPLARRAFGVLEEIERSPAASRIARCEARRAIFDAVRARPDG